MKIQNISIAYMLLVHKNPEQVNMFLKQILKDEDADIYIHIDKKCGELMKGKLIKHPRVYILEESVEGTWGDISLVDATILLLKKVVYSGRNYDFVCLRSGQDLMVKEGYKKYLAENKDRNFMEMFKVEKSSNYVSLVNINWPKCTRKLYDNMHPFRLLRLLLKNLYGIGINLLPNKDSLPENFDLYCGEQWFSISMKFAGYIIDFLNENPWYYKAFKNSLAPDTWFFQTLIKNSSFSDTVVNSNHVYIKWGKTKRDSNHPVTLTLNDINDIERTGNYFARKFDVNVDKEVIQYFYNKILSLREAK
jgi:hypothetical protein